MTDPPTARWARRAFLPHGSAGCPRGTPVIAYETTAQPALGSLTPVGHRQRSILAGARACAGACFRKLSLGGVPRTFGGISRKPRPLAPARPHRAGRLSGFAVTHALSGDGGVRGNEERLQGTKVAASPRQSWLPGTPRYTPAVPAIPALPASVGGRMLHLERPALVRGCCGGFPPTPHCLWRRCRAKPSGRGRWTEPCALRTRRPPAARARRLGLVCVDDPRMMGGLSTEARPVGSASWCGRRTVRPSSRRGEG